MTNFISILQRHFYSVKLKMLISDVRSFILNIILFQENNCLDFAWSLAQNSKFKQGVQRILEHSLEEKHLCCV